MGLLPEQAQSDDPFADWPPRNPVTQSSGMQGMGVGGGSGGVQGTGEGSRALGCQVNRPKQGHKWVWA